MEIQTKRKSICVFVSQKFIVIHLKISVLLEVTTFEQEVLFCVLFLEFVLLAFQYYCFLHSLLIIDYSGSQCSDKMYSGDFTVESNWEIRRVEMTRKEEEEK